jgi:hypothetical protein
MLATDIKKILAIIDIGIERWLIKDYSQVTGNDRFAISYLSKKEAMDKFSGIYLGEIGEYIQEGQPTPPNVKQVRLPVTVDVWLKRG